MLPFKKRLLAVSSALLLGLSALLGGCTPKQPIAANLGTSKEAEKLEAITDIIFRDIITTDALTAHTRIKDLASYDIELDEYTLGEVVWEISQEDLDETNEALDTLRAIDDDQLDDKQKITKEVTLDALETAMRVNESPLLSEPLSASNGLQSILPIILNEYTFYSTEDVDHYLELVKDTKRYFQDLLEFEKAKADAGLLMTEDRLDALVENCEDFIAAPEENLLLTTFPGRLDKELPNLTGQEKNAYIRKNEQAVTEYLIPAYQLLIDELPKLRPQCSKDGSMASKEGGKEYYKALFRQNTCSSMTPEEAIEAIEAGMSSMMLRLSMAYSANPAEYEAILKETPKMVENDPEKVLTLLKESMAKDFPEIPDVTQTINYVDESLQDSIAPAFYIFSPLDDYRNNNIYINGGDEAGLASVFTLLAHEGYPGHMYQYTYFLSTQPNKLRPLLPYLGYTEGWATYMELSHYDEAYESKTAAELFMADRAYGILLMARADLGIHYEGWGFEEWKNYAAQKGLAGSPEVEEMLHQVYDMTLDMPGDSIAYAVGYLEMERLREKADDALGVRFNLKEFHRFILDFGPAPFDIIEKHLDQWIEEHSA